MYQVQSLKAVEQAAADSGSWRHAWPLSLQPELIPTRRWTGTASELRTISGYQNTLDRLEQRVKPSRGSNSNENPNTTREENPPPGKCLGFRHWVKSWRCLSCTRSLRKSMAAGAP